MKTPYDIRLQLDQSQRIVAKTEYVNGESISWRFKYDGSGRLTEAYLDDRLIFQGGYDHEGRRMRDYAPASVEGQYRDFKYTQDNRLMVAGKAQYSHDGNGFRSIQSFKGEYTFYQYSPDYRLLKAEKEDDGLVFRFDHDDNGQRTAKYINGVLEEEYFWHDLRRMARFRSGNNEYRFIYEDGQRTPKALATKNGEMFFLHYDQIGSLRIVADTDGNVITEILYDPFGGILNETNPAIRIPIGFGGGLHDRDLNLVRFGWRDYDPNTGRWTAPDPIEDKGGDPDWYGYCLDNPVNGVDPLGLKGNKFGGADSEAGLFFNIGRITYDNAKEQLTVTDTDGMLRKQYDATSGVPNATDQTKKNQGPTPLGEYRITPHEISPTNFFRKYLDPRDWGNYRTPMHQSRKTETHNRSGFMMHGGEKPGSAGCIDVGDNDENLFNLMKKQKKSISVKVK